MGKNIRSSSMETNADRRPTYSGGITVVMPKLGVIFVLL
jgi:hypothetical protein